MGGLARKKNSNLKVTNYIPPQIFERYRGAQEFAAELREKSDATMYTVRIERSDIRILQKGNSEESWKDISLPKNIPDFDNSAIWEGLTPSITLTEIEDFSPLKGELPSISNEEVNNKKRTNTSPLVNLSKKQNSE